MKKNNINTMESYRRLRNIMEGYSKVKCISITSNKEMDGKTQIAKNIALILAKSGKKTLFIDCNLCKNSNIKSIETNEINGLIGMLKGFDNTYKSDLELKSYISDTKCENLSMLVLGDNKLDNHMAIFNIRNLKIAIERLKISFDYIIMDTPSFENLSYAQIAASATDGCLFVLREGIHEVSEGRIIKDKLDTIGCKVLGCILNKEKTTTKVLNDISDSFTNVEGGTRKQRGNTKSKVNIEG